jgi:hypothetical protein
LHERRIGDRGSQRHGTAVTVAEDNDWNAFVLSACEGEQVLDVELEGERLKVSRTLVAAPVIGHDVKVVDASSEACEGATPVEPAVHADECRFRYVDATFRDRESRDG